MSDHHQTESYGSRLLKSIKGILFGVVLLLIAAFILWRNEGRTDYSRIADDSTAISAESINSQYDGEFVAARGLLTSRSQIGDPGYLLAGNYIRLNRNVEMYAWVERSDTEDDVTTYSYERQWTKHPADSSTFNVAIGHENPPLTLEDRRLTAPDGRVGIFDVDLHNMQLPTTSDLAIDASMIADERLTAAGRYIYLGDGNLATPQVGDVRISYRVVPAGLNVTAFGDQQGNRLVPHLANRDTSLYQAYNGSREAAIADMRASYRTTGWVNRLIGFGMMWLGLTLVLGPISAMLSFFPALGNLSRTMIRIVTFGFALVVSLFIIIVSAIVHSVVAWIIIGVIIIGAILLGQRDEMASMMKSA